MVVLADESSLVEAFSSATAPGVARAAKGIAPLLDQALQGQGTLAPPSADAAHPTDGAEHHEGSAG